MITIFLNPDSRILSAAKESINLWFSGVNKSGPSGSYFPFPKRKDCFEIIENCVLLKDTPDTEINYKNGKVIIVTKVPIWATDRESCLRAEEYYQYWRWYLYQVESLIVMLQEFTTKISTEFDLGEEINFLIGDAFNWHSIRMVSFSDDYVFFNEEEENRPNYGYRHPSFETMVTLIRKILSEDSSSIEEGSVLFSDRTSRSIRSTKSGSWEFCIKRSSLDNFIKNFNKAIKEFTIDGD